MNKFILNWIVNIIYMFSSLQEIKNIFKTIYLQYVNNEL